VAVSAAPGSAAPACCCSCSGCSREERGVWGVGWWHGIQPVWLDSCSPANKAFLCIF
jgi:hypothetical protein